MGVMLENTSLTDALSAALRKQIIAGDVAPGEKLSEAWVATRFDVARPTARASIDRLTHEGMLRRRQRRSAVVPQLSAEDIHDIYFSREPIESRAVVALAERGEVPPEADKALAMMSMAADSDQHAEHTEADISLHRALVKAAGSPRLRRMHETVMGESQLCIAQVRNRSGVDLAALTRTHAAILDAIRACDPDEAVEALKRDLYGCRDTLLLDVAKKIADIAEGLRAGETSGCLVTADAPQYFAS